ncbi:NAD(P)H-dependent amine dehydrogenase family protein [Labrys monachus]|uniref:4-hydroxy-tetrahydrodipicolinate reductase n=1 Tax=Labrys monachus TaxID=217067 RepID=A0ABU0FEV4_9HYPH|nr:hypothetical protein [Labrys monachus]MDQ0393145.1 4-hydroxy-tetrahydrodipicolinate reductase [Labrys monachus]
MIIQPEPSSRATTIVLFGLGAMGSLVIRCLMLDHPRLRVVGAVDHAPEKVGRRLGDLYAGLDNGADVAVARTLDECLAALPEIPDLLLHMTESGLDVIEEQLMAPLRRGINVVSASEAMWHPLLRFPQISQRLDAAAKAGGVTITGCGINPGFVYDSLPLLLSRATGAVRSIRITRTIDVTGTGPGDIEHVGYGLTLAEFEAGIAAGRIVGHMGAPESVAMLAERLDMPLDRIEEHWDTEAADFPVESGSEALGMIEPGRVIGITQYCRGFAGSREIISTRLQMYYQPERFGLVEADEIVIDGSLPIHMTIKPALASLFGAANVIVSAVQNVVDAAPGLVNVLDLPVAGARRAGWQAILDPAKSGRPGKVWIARQPSGRA